MNKDSSKKQDKQKSNIRWIVFLIFVLTFFAASLDYPLIWDKGADFLNKNLSLGIPHFHKKPFKLGLDLQGGTHLVYQADFSEIKVQNEEESIKGVRDVIERRVNIFGVTESLVQINKVKNKYRLIVELPGVKDIHQAIEMIGQTPFLEFKEQKPEIENRKPEEDIHLYFKNTNLTGRHLEEAKIAFDQTTGQPMITLKFNNEGKELFKEITERNVGKRIAIYLDGKSIVDTSGDNKITSNDLYAPVVQESIVGGRAQITGELTLDEAKKIVQRLNAGALPVPITLISQQSIGASLGKTSLDKSLKAALIGLIAVALFMIIYYRTPGLLAVMALAVYAAFILAIFKLIPVTLTLAGIAGFILSVGMAVDANVLIFERMKEELKSGRNLENSINHGFKRAWPSIRDGNISTLMTATILFYFGTGIIKGFALTLFIGVLISMLTAIIVTRTFLKLFYVHH